MMTVFLLQVLDKRLCSKSEKRLVNVFFFVGFYDSPYNVNMVDHNSKSMHFYSFFGSEKTKTVNNNIFV